MFYEDKHKPELDLYLFSTKSTNRNKEEFFSYYISNLTLPIKSTSIEDYKIWENGTIENAFAINKNYWPQLIRIKSIDTIISFSSILKDCFHALDYKYKVTKEQKTQIMEQLNNWFGISINFKETFTKMQTLPEPFSIYTYRSIILDAYKVVIEPTYIEITGIKKDLVLNDIL